MPRTAEISTVSKTDTNEIYRIYCAPSSVVFSPTRSNAPRSKTYVDTYGDIVPMCVTILQYLYVHVS